MKAVGVPLLLLVLVSATWAQDRLRDAAKAVKTELGLDEKKEGIEMADLKRVDIASTVRQMSEGDRDDLCKRSLKGGADEDMLARLKASGADCVEAMKRDRSFVAEGGEAEAALKVMKGEKPTSQWTRAEWTMALSQMASALKPDDIRGMTPDTVRKLLEGDDLKKAVANMTRPSDKRAVEDQLKSAFGGPEVWDKSAIEKMGSLIGSLSLDTLDKIPKDKMKEAMSSLRDVEFDDAGKRAAAGRRIVEGLGMDRVREWTSETIEDGYQFFNKNPTIIRQLKDSALLESLEYLGSRKTDMAGAAQLSKRFMKMANFSDPSKMDSSKMEKLGHFMKAMGRKYLSKLPKDAVEGALDTLANVTFSPAEAREIMEKVKKEPGSYTAEKVMEFGKLITGMDKSDLEVIPADAIEGALEKLADMDFDVTQCLAIYKKVKSKKALLKKLGKLLKCVPLDDLKDASIDDLGLDCRSDTPPSFTPDAAQSAEMFKKLAARYGKPSASNANYTLSCMKKWGRVAALGMEPSDFENLPDNGDMKSIFEKLAEYESDMDDGQTHALSKRLWSFLKMNDSSEVTRIGEDTIEQVGKFMKHFNDSALEKFNLNIRPAIARKIGEANMDRMPLSELRRLKNFALKHVKSDATGRVEDRRDAAILDDNAVRDLGNIFGGMEEYDVDRMDKTAMKNNMVTMNDKIRDLAVQMAAWENARSKDPSFLRMSENIIGMSGLAGGLESGLLNAINKSVLAEAMTDASEMMEKRKEKDDRRDRAGFEAEMNSTVRTNIIRQKMAFFRKALDGFMESQEEKPASGGQTQKRQRLACQDVRALGGNIDILSVAQIDELNNEEFSDCAEALGNNSRWDKEQLAKLASKAKQTFGKTSDWSPNVIKLIGSVAAGLGATDIEDLELDSTTLLANMGKSGMFSPEQLKAGFRTMMGKAHGGEMKNLTGDDLMAIGSFVCGAMPSEINEIPGKSFKTAASIIGSQNCGLDQMKSFAKKAKESLGDVSRWDKSIVKELGNVVSGLEQGDMGSLGADLISSIKPETISKFDPSAMARFSRDQLSRLSIAQISGMSRDQTSALPSSMKSMLQDKLPKVGMRTVGNKKVMPGGIELEKNKQGMDISQLKRIDPSALGDAVRQMSESDRDTLCQRAIRGGANSDMLSTLKEQGADCVQAMKRDPSFKLTGGAAEAAMKQMREEKEPDWKVALIQMPSAVKADDIKNMDRSTFRDLVTGGYLKEAAVAMKRPSDKRALETSLKNTFGEPTAWNKEALESMGSLLGSMETETFRNIPKEQMRAAASSFKDIPFDDLGKKAACGRQIVDGLGDASSWTSEDIANVYQFIDKNPKIIRDLSDSALASSLSDIGARETTMGGAAKMGARIKNMNEYKDPTAVDSSKLNKMGYLAQGLGKQYLKQLPTDAINGALSTLANVSFPRGDARELVSKIKGSVGNFTGDRLRQFGKLAVGLKSEDFDLMPESAIASVVEDLADMDFDSSQCRAIVKKVMTSGKANIKKLGKLMSKCVSTEDLKEASLEDLGLACDTDTPPSMTPDKPQSKAMFKLIRERFGSPSEDNTNYTLSCMRGWGRVAALGMEPSDFENLPDKDDLKSVFEKLAEHESDMDEGQTRAIAKRLRRHLDMDNATAVAGHDSAAIEQVGVFLKHFNDTDLEKFNKSVRPDVARKIGEANLDKQTGIEKKRLKRFALKHVKRDSNSTVTDRRNVTAFDDNDMRDLGDLFGGLEKDDIMKMDKTSMENNMVAMSDKVRDADVKKAVWTNAQNKDPTFLSKTENVVAAAGLASGLPNDMLTSMNKTVMGEALADSASMMETRRLKDKLRDDAGFKTEISDSDRQIMESQESEYVKKAFQGYLDSQSTTGNRRKRATVSVTCSDVQVLGSNAVSLTTTQIESLSSSDFTDCTETLGGIPGWSTSQLSSLATMAKTVYGAPSTWSSSNIKLIGSMCAGLTADEISTLDLSSASVLATMGTASIFSSTQLIAGFARFLTRSRGDAMSSVTGDDLLTIGNFACGATTSQIQQIQQAAFTTAATSIGKLATCDASQLAAYATLAKTAYGSPSTWDSATITSLGSIIAGLSSSEVGTLSATQISSISATSISQIPATSFTGFSTTQISGFTASQANAVTANQQAALSSTQKEALISVGASDLTTSSSNAGAVRMSLLSVLATIFVFFL